MKSARGYKRDEAGGQSEHVPSNCFNLSGKDLRTPTKKVTLHVRSAQEVAIADQGKKGHPGSRKERFFQGWSLPTQRLPTKTWGWPVFILFPWKPFTRNANSTSRVCLHFDTAHAHSDSGRRSFFTRMRRPLWSQECSPLIYHNYPFGGDWTWSAFSGIKANPHSDPYCKISLGNIKHKTSIIYNTLNPVWNEEFTMYALTCYLATHSTQSYNRWFQVPRP